MTRKYAEGSLCAANAVVRDWPNAQLPLFADGLVLAASSKKKALIAEGFFQRGKMEGTVQGRERKVSDRTAVDKSRDVFPT